MIKRLQEDRDVVLFCDLHGHSRKHNVFCYGCEAHRDARAGLERQPRALVRRAERDDGHAHARARGEREREGGAPHGSRRKLRQVGQNFGSGKVREAPR